MPEYTFSTVPVVVGAHTSINPSQAEVEATPTLRRASLEAATLFGGPVVRAALEQCPLQGDRPHVLVDTKVTLLMPGWFPAIPGWHTDGVPRGKNRNPAGTGAPDLSAQTVEEGPRFHTIVLGLDNLTRFLRDPITLDIDHDTDRDLYKEVSHKVNAQLVSLENPFVPHTTGQWLSWGHWNLHSATPSDGRGWRLLVRVTESDVPPSDTGFLRSQNQVYVPIEVGW